MARTTSVCPREESARAQAAFPGLGKRLGFSLSKITLGSERSLQTAAGLHLLAIAAAVLGPASPPLPIFLTVTGLLLVVLSLSRPIIGVVQTPFVSDDELDEREVRALALERQAQRLVEIADTANRARQEAEMRSQLWAEITARMSHELRTPLNAVIGFSDLMSSELFGPLGHERYRDYTLHIRESGRDLLKCTEDTLALTSSLAKPASQASAQPLNLPDLISDAWRFYEAESGARGIRLVTSLPAGLQILGEPRPIRQILINLLSEALARVRNRGTITVEMQDDGSVITLAIRVDGAIPRADVGQAPLAICIARVLLEQQGSGLIENDDDEVWCATTFFDRAIQHELFGCETGPQKGVAG
jgi:signal transduction histidine kinase